MPLYITLFTLDPGTNFINLLQQRVVVHKMMWRNMLLIKEWTPRRTQVLFSINALGYFTCGTQHTGPTALRPIWRTKHVLVVTSVLLKDTGVTCVTNGTRTHTLLTKNTRVWIRCSYPIRHDTPKKMMKTLATEECRKQLILNYVTVIPHRTYYTRSWNSINRVGKKKIEVDRHWSLLPGTS